MIIHKIKKYGLIESFYRALHRLVSKLSFSPSYLFRKYIFGYVIREINGVKMYLDLKNDSGISKFLMIHGKREPLTVDYLMDSNLLSEGDVVLDIGANIGYYALLESKLIGETGEVYAVEPIKNNLNNLKRNIKLNEFKNIKTYNLAMGDKDNEEVEIYMRSHGNLSSLTSLPSNYGDVVSVERVLMSKKELPHPPKYIRMDVEGYEGNILEGMQNTLSSRPCLQIEFHPTILTNGQKERVCAILREKGYDKVVITANPKPPLSPIIRWLNNKLGTFYHESGDFLEGGIEDLHKWLFSSPRIFNAFIS